MKTIRFHKSAQDGWLQKQFFLQRSFAAAPQRPVDQIYLCGKVQSHTTLALAVAKGSTPEHRPCEIRHN
jgi:hypothetical protein